MCFQEVETDGMLCLMCLFSSSVEVPCVLCRISSGEQRAFCAGTPIVSRSPQSDSTQREKRAEVPIQESVLNAFRSSHDK